MVREYERERCPFCLGYCTDREIVRLNIRHCFLRKNQTPHSSQCNDWFQVALLQTVNEYKEIIFYTLLYI